MKENKVETLIKSVAENKIAGKYNLSQYKAVKAKMVTHKQVCEQIMEFKKNNPTIPTYIVLSAGVGTGAFKMDEYNKGYKTFNADKVINVVKMAEMYNKHMNIKGKPSDVTYRIAIKFYNKVSHNVSDFELALNKANIMDGNRGHFAELCSNLGIE